VLSGRGFEESTKSRQSVYETTGKYAFVDIDQRYHATLGLPLSLSRELIRTRSRCHGGPVCVCVCVCGACVRAWFTRSLTQPSVDLTRFKARHFLNIPINGWISQTSWELVREAQKRGTEETLHAYVSCRVVSCCVVSCRVVGRVVS
jgi:hypothetical protein